MRTTGTLKQVYDAAKTYYNGGTTYGGKPMDPVVRFENGKWMLESALEPAPNATVECRLDDFDGYFCETYADDNFEITADVEEQFREMFEIEDEDDR